MLTLFMLAGCNDETNYDDKVKVVFVLQGGTYQNSDLPVTYYYDVDKDEEFLISDPSALSKEPVTRTGYTLIGWYEGTVGNDGSVAYYDEWKFDINKVSGEGITLYAKWKKDIKYTYNVCYYDENDTLQTIGSYEVGAGEEFEDYLNYANKRLGYTALNFYDEQGEPWDAHFKHPGGEADLAVNVIVDYIKGEYAVVRNAAELKANRTKSIYLAADIDFDGADFAGFGNYNKTFIGNGHTISNFKLGYSATNLISDAELDEEGNLLCVSLFGNVAGATVKDVTFENVTVDLKTQLSKTKKIFVAPISVKVTNSTISNVSYSGSFKVSDLPDGFNREENLIVVTDRPYYLKNDASAVSGCAVNIVWKN